VYGLCVEAIHGKLSLFSLLCSCGTHDTSAGWTEDGPLGTWRCPARNHVQKVCDLYIVWSIRVEMTQARY
jgi:hypothetical protein